MATVAYGASSPADAASIVHAAVAPVALERVPLKLAPGRVLAEPVLADRDSPAADLSAMDGYAVRLADLRPGFFPVNAAILIGHQPPVLPQTAALKIVTGACIPAGADAVIKREDVQESPGRIELSAAVIAATRPGQHIRRRAENTRARAEVCPPGTEITPPVAGALASFGISSPLVYRRVRCAVLITGDELLSTDEAPSPWQVRDSNGYSLRALLSGPEWLELVEVRRERDDPDSIAAAAAALLRASDALFFTGGVSMGDRDFIPGVLANLGARTLFHKVPQRPGKPVLCAVSEDSKPIFALPGNPVSVMVTARRLAAPVLRRMAGLPPRHQQRMTLSNPDDKRLELWWHRPVRLTSPGFAELTPTISSGDVAGVALSDGFVEVPPNANGPGPWDYYPWTI